MKYEHWFNKSWKHISEKCSREIFNILRWFSQIACEFANQNTFIKLNPLDCVNWLVYRPINRASRRSGGRTNGLEEQACDSIEINFFHLQLLIVLVRECTYRFIDASSDRSIFLFFAISCYPVLMKMIYLACLLNKRKKKKNALAKWD